MTVREYVLGRIKQASELLQIRYTKQTVTSLQSWATSNAAPFSAVISSSEARSRINSTVDLVEMTIGIYVVISTDNNITQEDINDNENQANELMLSLISLIKSDDFINVKSSSIDTIYRESSYLGMGCASVLTISMPDKFTDCKVLCKLPNC